MHRTPVFLILLAALPLLAFTTAHKFYLSVTNVDYSEKDQSLQIISRVFVDDFEDVLQARYDFDAGLGTESESPQADAWVERYFRTKFRVWVNGEEREYNFLGRRYDRDLVVCFIEVPGVSAEQLKSVGLQNEVLTDLFEEQKNLVHFSVLGTKKSMVLIRENSKGMLNL